MLLWTEGSRYQDSVGGGCKVLAKRCGSISPMSVCLTRGVGSAELWAGAKQLKIAPPIEMLLS